MRSLAFISLAAGALLFASGAGAASGFRLPLGAAVTGGGVSSDGYHVLAGSLGQPVAGTLRGPEMKMEVGMLAGSPAGMSIVLPVLARDR